MNRNLAVAAVALLLIIVAGCMTAKPEGQAREVAATVNGEPVYFDDVNEFYSYQSLAEQARLSKADALSLVIEREILTQEAVKRGFTATKDEIGKDYIAFLSMNNLTEPELGSNLAAKNSSTARLKDSLAKRIVINKLLDRIAKKSYVIKKEEVEAVYNSGTIPQQAECAIGHSPICNFKSAGVSFEAAEKGIVDLLTAQRQRADTEAYVQGLKDNAKVAIIAVPG